jgi:excisionase family DNA binding protein
MNETRMVYTVKEVAARSGVSAAFLYRLIREGKFPVRVVHLGERVLIPASAWDAYINQRQPFAAEAAAA